MTTYYKIRRKGTDLYRVNYYKWNNTGKVYTTLGKLRSALTTEMRNGLRSHPSGIDSWEIVEYEVTVKAVRQPHELMTAERVVEVLTHQS
jgi:hypothetical protein